jgi:hypothetical protein
MLHWSLFKKTKKGGHYMAQPEVKKTPAVKSESVKSDKKARRAAKKTAFEVVKGFAEKANDPKLTEALKTIRPSLYGGFERTGHTNSLYSLVATAIAETGKNGLSAEALFKKFKVGNKEVGILLKKQLKKAEPANRIWITFNKDKETYFIVGTGAKAPDGWTGYLPVEENVNLK